MRRINTCGVTVTLGKRSELFALASGLIGKGGMCLTQALIINDGTEPLSYKAPTGFSAIINNIVYLIKSSLIWTIVVELTRL